MIVEISGIEHELKCKIIESAEDIFSLEATGADFDQFREIHNGTDIETKVQVECNMILTEDEKQEVIEQVQCEFNIDIVELKFGI